CRPAHQICAAARLISSDHINSPVLAWKAIRFPCCAESPRQKDSSPDELDGVVSEYLSRCPQRETTWTTSSSSSTLMTSRTSSLTSCTGGSLMVRSPSSMSLDAEILYPSAAARRSRSFLSNICLESEYARVPSDCSGTGESHRFRPRSFPTS